MLRLSSTFTAAGDTHARKSVRELPPSASRSSRVSLESRYGMCGLPDSSAQMTLPSASRPWLIDIPSFMRSPTAPVRFSRSLPARSTNVTFALEDMLPAAPDSVVVDSIVSVHTCSRHGVE